MLPLPLPRPAQASGLGSAGSSFWNNAVNICCSVLGSRFSSSDPLCLRLTPILRRPLASDLTELPTHVSWSLRSQPPLPLPPSTFQVQSRVVSLSLTFFSLLFLIRGMLPLSTHHASLSHSHTSRYLGEKMGEQIEFSPRPSLAQGWGEDSSNLKWKISWSGVRGWSGGGE